MKSEHTNSCGGGFPTPLQVVASNPERFSTFSLLPDGLANSGQRRVASFPHAELVAFELRERTLAAPEAVRAPPSYEPMAAPAGRTAEEDERVIWHESSHAVTGRLLSGAAIGGVSAEPGPDFAGLCWGPKCDKKHAYSVGSSDQKTETILNVIASTVPPLAAPVDVADLFAQTFAHTVEALAGIEGERLFVPGEPWEGGSDGDMHLACGLAALICTSPDSIEWFIAFCRAEASALLSQHEHIVRAVADELRIKRELDGAEVDACIERAVAAKAAAEEQARRDAMRELSARVAANHGLFEPLTKTDNK